MLAVPGYTTQGTRGASGNLPSSQVIKLPAANRVPQYTEKGSLCSESSPEEDNQTFYKRLQLVYLYLSNAGDQAWCPL
jgi:hypothetical protein